MTGIATIALLTHAPSDVAVMLGARQQLPADFHAIEAVDLQQLDAPAQMAALLTGELSATRIVLLRVLGRWSDVPGLTDLVNALRRQGRHLIAISGTGEPDAELAALSSVAPTVLHQTMAYFEAGGSANLAQLLRFLSDHLLLTGFGYDAPAALPDHGLYHPDLPQPATPMMTIETLMIG